MLNAIAVGGAIVSLLASPLTVPSETVEALPAAQVSVEVVTVLGSGCPTGTATAEYSPSTGTVKVSYDEFFAWRGPGADPTDFRRNCQLSLRVKTPAGYTYAVTGSESRGFAFLLKGATAVQATSYYYQGSSATLQSKHTITGPYADMWRTTDTAGELSRLGYAPCSEPRNLNVNTEIRVAGGIPDINENSFVTMESTVVYRIALKSCKG